jgi:hypothetical protein
MSSIEVGDAVEKTTGYKWPGIVVAKFATLNGQPRFVVECTVAEVAGALHIYSPEQLVHKNNEGDVGLEAAIV